MNTKSMAQPGRKLSGSGEKQTKRSFKAFNSELLGTVSLSLCLSVSLSLCLSVSLSLSLSLSLSHSCASLEDLLFSKAGGGRQCGEEGTQTEI